MNKLSRIDEFVYSLYPRHLLYLLVTMNQYTHIGLLVYMNETQFQFKTPIYIHTILSLKTPLILYEEDELKNIGFIDELLKPSQILFFMEAYYLKYNTGNVETKALDLLMKRLNDGIE